jgi:outer membrane protein OmpA-like peptidoglycan-associated protein
MASGDMSRRRFGSAFLAGSAWVLAGCGAAVAAEGLTEEDILKGLRGRRSRGPSASPADTDEQRLLDSLRGRPARGLSPQERADLQLLAKDKPKVDIEITFDYNSDVVGPKAMSQLIPLGRVLSNPDLLGTTFLINGHTDAKGDEKYNQNLSERRAEAVRRVLTEQFQLPAGSLIAAGYGKTMIKNSADPFAAENRRVQIVNTEHQTSPDR